MLKVENLIKQFSNGKGVKDISFEAKEGRILGILGRNGAGKSTLFRSILNIVTKDSGSVKLEGKDIDFKVIDEIGYLIEEGCLTPDYTVYDQFQMFGILKNMSPEEIEDALIFWLKKFNILEYLNMKIKNISKGNRQKLQFIVSVMHNPKLIILDEPFSGLDPISVEELKNVVLELKSKGKIIVLSSHQLEQTETLCDDILLINQGKMLLYGELNDIKYKLNKKKIIVVGKIDPNLVVHSSIYYLANQKIDTYAFYVNGEENIKEVVAKINEQEIISMSIESLSLEDIFREKAGESYEK